MDQDRTESLSSVWKTERAITVTQFQVRWTGEDHAAWYRLLLQSVKRWLERPHGDINFHLIQAMSHSTQALTGHVSFWELPSQDEAGSGCRMSFLLSSSGYGWTRVPTGDNTGWRLRSSLEEGPSNLQISLTPSMRSCSRSTKKILALQCRIVVVASRGRTVFVQMVNDMLGRKEKDERVREAKARAAHLRVAQVAVPPELLLATTILFSIY